MKIVQLAIVFLFMIAAVQFSHAAEENKAKKEKRFSNETNFALVNTTGNTEALTVALEYLQSFKDSSMRKLNSETALVTTITDIMALKISYSIFYNNDPRPSDLDDTDTILATSLVITY